MSKRDVVTFQFVSCLNPRTLSSEEREYYLSSLSAYEREMLDDEWFYDDDEYEELNGEISDDEPEEITYKDTDIPGQREILTRNLGPEYPKQIIEMILLYKENSFTDYFSQKAKNFYTQGKFMENFEDNYPWDGDIWYYDADYRRLSHEQLRGYFTWRTNLRKGIYKKTNSAFFHIYVYELINLIGVKTPLKAIKKMKDLYNYLCKDGDKGSSQALILREWIFDYAVINGIDLNEITDCLDTESLRDGQVFLILRKPNKYSDKEVYDALTNSIINNKTSEPISVKIGGDKAIHLYAALWRYATNHYKENRRSFTSICIGSRRSNNWYPLDGAIYYKKANPYRVNLYEIDEYHRFIYKDDRWTEEYYALTHERARKMSLLLQEVERVVRKYLGIGRPLKQKFENSWITPCFEAALEAERLAEQEAKKKKVKINFSSLNQIREDAGETRDSLLTEDEKMEVLPEENIKKDEIIGNFNAPINDISLNEKQLQVLRLLLRGESVKELLKTWHEMAEIFADSLNEALFDKIGDNAIECDGANLRLVEDYRDDIQKFVADS